MSIQFLVGSTYRAITAKAKNRRGAFLHIDLLSMNMFISC